MPPHNPISNPLAVEAATRRRFQVGAIYAIWGAILAVLGVSALAYLALPEKDESISHRAGWTVMGREWKDRPVIRTFCKRQDTLSKFSLPEQ